MKTIRSFAPWPVVPLCLLALVALLGCDGDPAAPQPGSGSGLDLTWEFQGLEPLGAGFVYEAWLIVAGEPHSVGRFDVAPGGTPDVAGSLLTPAQVLEAEAFVLSIEPATGDDPAPSDTKVLGGAFVAGQAPLSVGHPAALGDDFSGATGGFILETPTTAAIASDYDQGIWWLDPTAGPGASLIPPSVPAGWAYEGWVVTGSGPRSTGRFTSVTGADSDGPGAGAGPDGSPPFPGQDFITPALELVGLTAVVSVEPEPDDSPMPFALKPLVTAMIADVGAGVLQAMGNNAGANPTGLARLE